LHITLYLSSILLGSTDQVFCKAQSGRVAPQPIDRWKEGYNHKDTKDTRILSVLSVLSVLCVLCVFVVISSVRNITMAEWFEDESFWIETFPTMFPDTRFLVAEEQVTKALALAEIPQGAVLDLCCGPGRHSVVLAKLGFQVTAVDRTSYLLSIARERAARRNVEIEFVLEDMRHFVRPEAFDLVLNMFTSFGYFDQKDEDLQVLRNIHESLKPGGVFLIDVISKEFLAKNFQATSSVKGPDGVLVVERREICDDWTRIRNEWILIKDQTAKQFKFSHTIYSGQELRSLMQRAGFDLISLFGDLDGNEYGINATRLIAMGRK
jgi:SAM-dependent methyltransferase